MMNNLQDRIDYYQSQLELISRELTVEKNKIYRIGTLRLLLFVGGVTGVIWLRHNWVEATMAFIIFIVLYLLLVKVHSRMFKRKAYLEKAKLVNEQELKAINYDVSDFDDGIVYIDATHDFSFDIDVFGKKSLFQSMCRTVTALGKTILSNCFITPLDTKDKIIERQQAICELTGKVDFRQRFRITGLLYESKFEDEEALRQWNKSENYFSSRKYFSIIKWVVPAINVVAIVLYILGVVPFTMPGFLIMLFVLLSIGLGKYITKEQATSSNQLQILQTYINLIGYIEKEKFESYELKEIQQLFAHDGLNASEVIEQLSHSVSALDQRNNIFVTAILNGLFFWELHRVMKIEQWKKRYCRYLPQWLDCIGKVDALCSLSTYAYNNPSFVYPEISDTPKYQADGLKHPLMDRDKCIPNPIDMAGAPRFNIITGANMAGKSTYLRTIAVNHLLAMMGMPIDGISMTIFPAHLITSLRTSDSLTDGESYFFAELKRLRMIIDKLESGEKLFIILDEILRGTNSVDKQKGSYAFLKQLVINGATGLIATHDLQLATLRDVFPECVGNQCFEADIENNELTFSYQLRDGIAQNMNACFLMKKMGIEID
jgi:DNA mismatch repair ATPase MutS